MMLAGRGTLTVAATQYHLWLSACHENLGAVLDTVGSRSRLVGLCLVSVQIVTFLLEGGRNWRGSEDKDC